jgi:transposase
MPINAEPASRFQSTSPVDYSKHDTQLLMPMLSNEVHAKPQQSGHSPRTMIERHWDGIAAYCRPENKVSLGFVEGLNNKIHVIQRRAYGLRNEEYFRLKVLTCMLPEP